MNAQKKALQDWLTEQNAQPLWHGTVRGVGSVQGYNIRGALVLVLRTERGGWDLLMPVCQTTNIVDTLRAAEQLIEKQS